MADYRIELGIGLQGNDFAEIQKKIKSLESDPIKIKIDDTQVDAQIQGIKNELNNLGKTKGLKLDTTKLETSLTDVKGDITEIKNLLGSLGSGTNMKGLVSSIGQISTALDKASGKFDELAADLKTLSSKDFSLNIGVKLGGSNSVANNAAYGDFVKDEVLPSLKKQEQELTKYIAKHFNTNEISAINKLAGKDLGGISGIIETMDRLESPLKKGESLKDRMRDFKNFINTITDAANIQGIDLSPVLSQFEKLPNELIESADKIRDGTKQVDDSFEKLKNLFGSDIDGGRLSAQLDSIVADLTKIKTALQGISSGVSLDGLTSSFDRLSNSIETLVKNAVLVKQTLGDSLGNSASIDTGATNKIEKASDDSTAAVIQNEKRKQEAYKATADAVGYHAGVISKLNKAETNGRFYGSNRGTGYFGTGHYFVDSATKHELDNDNYYNKMPYTSVDISQYDNLFKATTDEVAEKLHSFLGNLTRFTQGADDYDISELFAQFKSVFGDTIMDVKEFGSRLDQLKAFMSNSSLDDRSDSVSTQFMKSLGYEGVDTRGTRFADTRYGTVIYDLKEESILQANITDELQKQGQMLEKINYAKGQAFDKDTDARIQGELDAQAKKREIAEEFQNSFDTTNLNKIEADLSEAQSRLKQIDEIINDCQYSINNADQEAKKFAKDMESVGLGVTDEEIADWKSHHIESMQSGIDDLSQEKAELQSKISILEEAYNKENQLANETYKQAQQTVEQRHLEAQQAQESANAVVQAEERKQQAYRETADTADQVSKVKIGNTELDALNLKEDIDEADRFAAALSKIKNVQKNIDKIEIGKLDTSKTIQELETLETQLESLSSEYNETVKELNDYGGLSKSQWQPIQNEIDNTKLKLQQLESQIEGTKSELAEKIKLEIDTDITDKISKVHSDFNRLSDKTDELRHGLNTLDDIKIDLDTAKANNDIDALINAKTRYIQVLKDVNSQLAIAKRAERDANRGANIEQQKLALEQKSRNLSLDMSNWLRDNSAAAKQFGGAIKELQMRLQSCDDVEFNNIKGEFQQITKEAKALGLTTKTVGDRIKQQFAQYSTYLSVAEIFMYAEQGLRSMFEQVKLIDSAMTELKKVTDETDASYNKFLSNAASRSKELGTTIDGLVSSTADFARLGYDFADAQGLAEVANIYAVVGDEIEGVEGATESLISTMAAFKDSASGMSNSDFAMSIIDKFNEIGELIA